MSFVAESAAAEKLQELGLSLDPSIQFDLDSMFPKLTGWGSTGEIKRKHKLIKNISPFLTKVLREGEEVLYVAQGVQFKLAEQYFMGYWAALINQTVFVLTNLRLIMVHSDMKGRAKHTYWMIFYNQIRTFKPDWSGQIRLDLEDGQKLRFTGFRGTDKKQMPAIFERALTTYRELGFNPQSSQSLENLCSTCLEAVPKNHFSCSHCSQRFWKPSELALRSFIFPSWGDLLMRHYPLALAEMLSYAVSWLVIIGMLVGAQDATERMINAGIAGFILAFEHCADAALTYFMAKKGLIPRGR